MPSSGGSKLVRLPEIRFSLRESRLTFHLSLVSPPALETRFVSTNSLVIVSGTNSSSCSRAVCTESTSERSNLYMASMIVLCISVLPYGVGAMSTMTSDETRSGYFKASIIATFPPIEWPIRCALSTPSSLKYSSTSSYMSCHVMLSDQPELPWFLKSIAATYWPSWNTSFRPMKVRQLLALPSRPCKITVGGLSFVGSKPLFRDGTLALSLT
mmetsp:Transcript_41497/g.101293  ORF Transcript_41497/g.101293 Transcript_41497/m.101293 type:complete len:213 (+) Transcript_41497:263-901(+)